MTLGPGASLVERRLHSIDVDEFSIQQNICSKQQLLPAAALAMPRSYCGYASKLLENLMLFHGVFLF